MIQNKNLLSVIASFNVLIRAWWGTFLTLCWCLGNGQALLSTLVFPHFQETQYSVSSFSGHLIGAFSPKHACFITFVTPWTISRWLNNLANVQLACQIKNSCHRSKLQLWKLQALELYHFQVLQCLNSFTKRNKIPKSLHHLAREVAGEVEGTAEDLIPRSWPTSLWEWCPVI